MHCLLSPLGLNGFILMNGSPTVPFKMERGLTQGNPLCLFLFVLIAVVLNCLLIRAKEIGIMEGVEVRRDKIDVSHLQCADDMLIFCPAKLEIIQNIQRVPDWFALMSDLTINYAKPTLIPLGCDEEWVHVQLLADWNEL